jgi:hypothetical protein
VEAISGQAQPPVKFKRYEARQKRRAFLIMKLSGKLLTSQRFIISEKRKMDRAQTERLRKFGGAKD